MCNRKVTDVSLPGLRQSFFLFDKKLNHLTKYLVHRNSEFDQYSVS